MLTSRVFQCALAIGSRCTRCDGSIVGLVGGKPEEVKILEVLDGDDDVAEETANASGNLKLSTSPILKGVMGRATRRSGVAGIHVLQLVTTCDWYSTV